MKIYNYSEARQNFASILSASLKEEVIVKRKDGSEFRIVPVVKKNKKSPFAIDGITSDITTTEIVDTIRDQRESR